MTNPARNPVAVSVAESGTVVVACDDGTVWVGDTTGGSAWRRIPDPIPGSLDRLRKQAPEET